MPQPKRPPRGSTPAPDPPDAWVNATTGAQLLGINPRAFTRLASSGRLTRKVSPPGTNGRVLYLRSELEAIASASVIPARTG